MLRKVLGLIIVSTLFSPPAFAENLLEVYQLAMQNDPTFRAAQASLRIGLENEKLGLAEILPKVNVNLGFNFPRRENMGQFPAGGLLIPNNTKTNSTTRSWGISLDQPVFDLEAWFLFQRGQELTQQAKAQFASDQQSLIIRVVEAYVEVLRSRANLDASRAQEKATQRQLELARERFKVGLAAITDVREAEAANDLAIANRLGDEGELRVALEKLSVLTGHQHHDLWVLKQDFPVAKPDPIDSEEWVRFALTNNLDIKAAGFLRDAAHQAARAAGARHLPKITTSLNYGQNHSEVEQNNTKVDINQAFEIDNTQGSVAVNLNIPLFAGGGISAGRRQAYAEYDRSSEQYLGTVRTTEQATRALVISVLTNVAQVKAGQRAVISSRASLEATEAGYQVGTRNIIDVLTAVRAVYSATRDYANARLDYVLSKLRLKRFAGTLSPADVTDLNQWLQPPAQKQQTDLALPSGLSSPPPDNGHKQTQQRIQ